MAKLPFLCIITPIFNQCLPSLKILISELRTQTEQDFIHIMISNGPSNDIIKYLRDIQVEPNKFVYDELPQEPTDNVKQLLSNVGKRRNYCLKKYNTDRFLFIDADDKILSNEYFEVLRDR